MRTTSVFAATLNRRRLLAGTALVALTIMLAACGAAGTTSAGTTTASAPSVVQSLQSFTVADLEAAEADATAHGDTIAATCYAALIPAVQSQSSLIPAVAPKGGFSAFQAGRDVVNGLTASLPAAVKGLNVPCAPLVLDTESTIVGLAAKVGVSVAAPGLALPIPLP